MSDVFDHLLSADDADRLLAHLADALMSELTPAHTEVAVDAFWMARTDALVAELEEHLDASDRAGVRSATSDVRQLAYRFDDVRVTLAVDSVDGRVHGAIDGVCRSARWLDASGSSRVLALDDSGRFRTELTAGPTSVEVELADGRTFRTTWTLL